MFRSLFFLFFINLIFLSHKINSFGEGITYTDNNNGFQKLLIFIASKTNPKKGKVFNYASYEKHSNVMNPNSFKAGDWEVTSFNNQKRVTYRLDQQRQLQLNLMNYHTPVEDNPNGSFVISGFARTPANPSGKTDIFNSPIKGFKVKNTGEFKEMSYVDTDAKLIDNDKNRLFGELLTSSRELHRVNQSSKRAGENSCTQSKSKRRRYR